MAEAANGIPSGQGAPALPAPFVVGVARSGTTLLRLMLDAHPELAIPPETHFVPRLAERCGTGDRESAACVLEALATDPRWPDFGLDREALGRRLEALESFTLGGGLRAFYQLYAGRFGKARWGDKTPRYLIRMSLIQQLLPEARFVHLIRDGRDIWLSLRALSFGPDSVETAAADWASRIARARTQARTLPFYMEVRYEDLVLEPEATLRRICEFLDLTWDPVMLDYHDRAAARLAELQDVSDPATGRVAKGVNRQRIHALTGVPPQAERVGRWRAELEGGERQRYEGIAGALLRELGYEVG